MVNHTNNKEGVILKMSAKLANFKNPLTSAGGNLFSISDWLGGIFWVVWVGIIFSVGAKLLSKADTVIPGDVTPSAYKNMSTIPQASNGPVIY
jgi:hypothetical protein